MSLIKKLKTCSNLVIYGAGVEGKKLYRALKIRDIKVDCFAITDGNNKVEDTIDGVSVKFLSEIADKKEYATVIVATCSKYHFEITCNLYENGFKEVYCCNKDWYEELNEFNNYVFEDRRKNLSKMCMVLAGYKEFLWEDVFSRLKKFAPNDIDICILSSGIYNSQLSSMCEANNWSYLSTENNSVGVIQNMAIKLFKSADMIFKLDEDIFITENYFESMLTTYKYVCDHAHYDISFLAPLIPLNSYGYVRFLEKFGLEDVYKEKFGSFKYSAETDYKALSDPNVAKFFWGEGGVIDKIDNISKRLYNSHTNFSICPTRFSIGAILFSRDFWEEINHFKEEFPGMGLDEKDLCCEGMLNSKVIVVNENILVGHFSFAIQTEGMKEYYLNHPEMFKLEIK